MCELTDASMVQHSAFLCRALTTQEKADVVLYGEVREFDQKQNHEIIMYFAIFVSWLLSIFLHASEFLSPLWQLLAVRSGTYDINGKA